MLLTEYRNGLDLSRGHVSFFDMANFQDWADKQPHAECISVVLINGELLTKDKWSDPLPAGADVRVLYKPGDPTFWWTVAINIGLSAAAYLLTPRPKGNKGDEQSTAYTLGAQQNSARLGMPIPVQYGTHRIWPDLLAQPFSVYNNNNQYLYQLFCIGIGEFDAYELANLQIEDTSVANFEEVTYEYYYNEPVTLFPTDVVTSVEVASQELSEAYTGPFTVNATATTANKLEIDLVWDQGLFRARSDGDTDTATTTITAEYREIDDAGSPIGDWQNFVGELEIDGEGFPVVPESFVGETFSEAKRSALRITRAAEVTPGRYEVRVKRGEASQTGQKIYNRCVWEGLRGYLEDDAKTYTGLTVLAVRARATGNLSSNSSKRFNVVATRKIPVWNGSEWSAPVASNSIAWAMADMIRAEHGAERADALVDLAALLALDSVWSARGDEFNYRFDTSSTLWDGLKLAAAAGRTFPKMNGQVISFVRTQAQSTPVTLFNRHNTRRSVVKYAPLDTEEFDSVIAEYIDPDSGWVTNQVLCQPPSSDAANPKRVQYPGITDREQAFREGIHDAEAMLKQRKILTFETELEGYIPSEGDLIIFVNEDFEYEQGGEIVIADGLNLTTSEDLQWDSGSSYAIRLRKPDGSVDGPHLVSPGDEANQVVLTSPLDWTPETGGDQVRTLYEFGILGSTDVEWVIRVVKPRGGNIVEIECVNAIDSVHTVDEAEPPESLTPAPIAQNADGPVIRTLLVEHTSSPRVLHIAWSPAPGAEYYVIERRVAIDSSEWSPWTQWETTTSTQLFMPAPTGDIEIRVAGIGKAKGPWKTWTGTVGEYELQSPTDLDLTAAVVLNADGGYGINLVFTFTPPEDDYHIETFEAQYKLPRHGDWQPLYNALESRWEWSGAELGEYQVRVRSVYVQGEDFSEWAETTETVLGTYASLTSIGLNDPLEFLLFITADYTKQNAGVRISVNYDPADGVLPESFLLFYSIEDQPNQLVIGVDDGDKLYIKEAGVSGEFSVPVIAGSTTTEIRYTDPTGIIDIDLSGTWWASVGSGVNGDTRYFNIHESSSSELILAPGDELPFIPLAGDTVNVVETDWHDTRLPEFKLVSVRNEIIKHRGIDYDEVLGYYIDVVERGAEGTTEVDQSNQVLDYFCAPGPGTYMIPIPFARFSLVDGIYKLSETINVRIPGQIVWASASGCFVREATQDEGVVWVRSIFVLPEVAGPA